MAAANILPMQLYQTFGSWEDAGTWSFAEGASQTFKAGIPVKFSSGTIIAFASDNDVWAGVSYAAATGTTGSATNLNCQIVLPMPHFVFRLTVDGAPNGGNAPATGKPSDITIGTTVAVAKDGTSGLWYARSTGGNASILYLGPGTDQNSLVNGWGLFTVLPASTVYQP